MEEYISKLKVIDMLYDWSNHTMTDAETWHLRQVIGDIKSMPSAHPEPLTDREQRIFLVAMRREEKVCREVEKPHEDSLVSVCREIMRKVKGALWT